MLKWTAYLKHLQLILLAYNSMEAPAKSIILKYFQKGSRSFYNDSLAIALRKASLQGRGSNDVGGIQGFSPKKPWR